MRSASEPALEVRATARQFLGMPVARFLRDYWQQRPLLVRGALPMQPLPLQPEDLAGLACEEFALARLVRYQREHDRWSLQQGPFAESVFPALPRQDWTLLVQDVDKWDADVRGLLDCFSFLPRWRIDDVMVSYAAAGGSVGPHVDQYDVFLIQGLGARRWQIDLAATPDLSYRDDCELRVLQRFSASHGWNLAPGDLLYLPPGVPHFGEAIEPCMTFSVGMRAPSLAEMIADLADHVAERWGETPRYADRDLRASRHPGELDAAALRRARECLQGVLDDDDLLADWFAALASRYRASPQFAAPPKPPSGTQISKRLSRGSRLRRNPLGRLLYRRQAGGARLYALGEAYTVSLPLARALADQDALAAAEWQALSADDRAVVVRLVAAGHLVFERRRTP